MLLFTPEVIAAVIGALLGFGLTVFGKRNQDKSLKEQQDRAEKAEDERDALIDYKTAVQNALSSSVQVERYRQPTILVGPRAVGKTSLMLQWHTPWDYSPTSATFRVREACVPFYEHRRMSRKSHFADPQVETLVTGIFSLHVYDFPGELPRQKDVIEAAKNESQRLRSEQGKQHSGVVLICMFDASEAIDEEPTADTRNYYNGELFAQLRDLVSFQKISIARVIVVFNKFDLLENSLATRDSDFLTQRCIDTFDPLLRQIRDACNTEKICEVATVLDRGDRTINTRNATVVLGEASRTMVEAATSWTTADSVVQNGATQFIAEHGATSERVGYQNGRPDLGKSTRDRHPGLE